jgi:UPF0716 family protein affecting phage T7 exclusion
LPIDSPFAEWCWNLPLSVAIRSAPWPFPALEILHIVGLLLVFGTVLIVDLRLLGVLLRREPGWQISGDLMRWAASGFGVQILTGPLLFIANSRKFYESPFFRAKLVFLVVAIGFHFIVVSRVSASVDAGASPARARLAGGVSLVLWAAVIVSGISIEVF